MKTNTGYHGTTVLGARGDSTRQSDTRVFGRADRPNEKIIKTKGTNKGTRSFNQTTGMTIGGEYPVEFVVTAPRVHKKVYEYNYLPGGYAGKTGGTFINNPVVPHEGNNVVVAQPIRIPFYE